MIEDFHILDVIGGKADDPVPRLNGDLAAGGVFQPADGLVQHVIDGELIRRLHDKVQRIHLIALNGKLRHGRDENQHRAGIDFPHKPCHLKPIQLIHTDVHENNVIVFCAANEVKGRIKHADHAGTIAPMKIIRNQCIQRCGILRVIIDNRQQQHDVFTLP